MTPVLVDYEHFLGIADRLAWDERAIDLTEDVARWPGLVSEWRDRITAFVAGFALAEECVAVDLRPFVDAAPSEGMAECFRAQARDEERHARFFSRYAGEVLGADQPGDRVAPSFRGLFEERLRAAARDLASGRLALGNAVALYHLVLEGVVFTAGQNALIAELRSSGELPGLREGLERIARDERWHVGFGVRVLRGDPGDVTRPVDADNAIEAWGTLLPAECREAALRQHRRRLAAAGL